MATVDEILRHEIELQRFATELLRSKVYPSLDEAYRAVRLILADAETITSPTKLNRITREIKQAIDEPYSKAWADVTKELSALSVAEASIYAGIVGGSTALKVPGKATIQDFINESLMSLRSGNSAKVGLWGEFVKANVSGFTEQVNNLVKLGYTQNATMGQTTAAIRQYAQGIAKSQAEALARTGLVHYMTQARQAMVANNSDLIDREYPLVMFDNRRSQTCSSIYVKYSKIGWPANNSPIGYSPYHPNCRTTIIHKVKGQEAITGEMPAIGAGEDYPADADTKPKYRGRKDSRSGAFEVERVKYGTDLDKWMREQGRPFVADNLGATKAKLFYDGGLSLERMTDTFNRPLSINALMAKYPEAFKKAGI